MEAQCWICPECKDDHSPHSPCAETSAPNPNWVTWGTPGHFIGAKDCHWFKHTHVKNICVSSVGDYRPQGRKQEIGYQRNYEVMVFGMKGKEMIPRELLFYGSRTQEAAQANHWRACWEVEARYEMFVALAIAAQREYTSDYD